MRILIVHNRYQTAGGEDSVAASERDLLALKGDDVDVLTVHNDAIRGASSKLAAAVSAGYSFSHKRLIGEKLAEFRPDVVHLHNWFPVLSPSVLYACAAAGIPVVHTLHNYRMLCPNALLFRNDGPCESCVGKTFPWRGVKNRCYRDSMAGSAVVASITWAHRRARTFDRHVAKYIALTRFAREKFIEGGLDANKIVVKPNFIDPDPGAGQGSGDYVLYVGRLSEEKGISTLLRCWTELRPAIKLRIIGMGPQQEEVRSAQCNGTVEYLGPKSASEVLDAMGNARALIFPSQWYEGFPRTIVESFAKGTPVIASGLGSMQELIRHKENGLHFTPGSPESLAYAVQWMIDNPKTWLQMRSTTRADFESKYCAQENYRSLKAIYFSAIADSAPSASKKTKAPSRQSHGSGKRKPPNHL